MPSIMSHIDLYLHKSTHAHTLHRKFPTSGGIFADIQICKYKLFTPKNFLGTIKSACEMYNICIYHLLCQHVSDIFHFGLSENFVD